MTITDSEYGVKKNEKKKNGLTNRKRKRHRHTHTLIYISISVMQKD